MCLGPVDDTPFKNPLQRVMLLKEGKCVKFSHFELAFNTVRIMEKQRSTLYRRERKLKALQSHLERGTVPKTLRLKTFPKMKTPEGQAVIREACDEVQQLMLIQMVEEQRQALAQARKEYQNFQKPVETIKSLRKEIKSLRAQLLKLQTTEDSSENQAQVKQCRRQFKTEDTPKQIVNSPENQVKT